MQILSTKLSIPPLRSRLVARPGLVQKLNQASDCGFFLISAPAGYGKTTLLSAWLSQVEFNHAWLTLDDADNDPVRFLAYLAAAIHKVDPPSGEALEMLLQTSPRPAVDIFLTPLVNQLSQVDHPFWLVLDDYHQVQNQEVHQVVSFLLEHRPTPFHLVIATRADPPLPLGRLRARSQVVELRLGDLRFTSKEAEEFLSQVVGLKLSGADLALLENSTEGWVAGLQMAGLSLQGRSDVSAFIRSFSGENRFILDFLFNEVFQHLPAELQNFLLQTSILERLCGPLCDRLLLRKDSQVILDTLERSNVFLIALDERREWFRYHNLFSDLLRQRLQRSQPDLVLSLHLRASEWFEENGVSTEAIAHAFSSNELDWTARLIEKAADSTLLHGEIKTFLSWVERLPEVVASQWPLLCVYHVEALLLSGRPTDFVVKRLQGTPEYDAVKALMASYHGDVELSRTLSTQVLERLPDESVFLRGIITSSLGAVLLLSGDIAPAIQTFRRAADIGKEHGNLMLEVIALCRLGQLHQLGGELQKAEGFLRKALELSTDRQGNYLPVAGMPLMSLAYLLREWNDLDSALSYIKKAGELSQESGGFWSVDCYVVHAFVLQAQGDADGALEAIGKARDIAFRTAANPFDDVYTAAYEAQLFAAQGKLEPAVQWIRHSDLDKNQDSGIVDPHDGGSSCLYHLIEIEQTTLARVYLAQGKAEEALAILMSLLPESEKRGRKTAVIENLVLQSLVFQVLGKGTQALNAVEAALTLAEPGGYVRVFLDAGESLRGLLRKWAGRRRNDTGRDLESPECLENYGSRLLAAYTNHADRTEPMVAANRHAGQLEYRPGSLPIQNNSMVEPLSRREIEVLDLLSRGYSDKKIAEALVIARETVHRHLKNIYEKLGVHSRTEAIARARDFGLL